MKVNLTKPQYRVSTSNKRFRVLISGRRFGKTFLTIIEMMKYASQPNQTIWYIAPTLKMAKEICWNDLKETLNKYKWVEDINETTLTIRIRKTNSTISLKGAENFDSLRGSGIDFLVLDEFADIDKRTWFEVLRASVVDTKGKVLMCGTPRGYGNWSYEMYLKGKHDDEWESFQYTTLQGGIVTKEELEQAKQDIDIRTFRQEFEGTFENYAGQVYYNFHPVESVKDYKLDLSKPLHMGMDFNVDPMSCCVAHIEKDKVYFVDEIVIYSSNTDEMCQEIRDRYGSKAKIFVYPDPACKQRKTSAGGRTDLSILQNSGFNVKVKNKHAAIRDRVNNVNSRLKDSNGERHIFIGKNLKILLKGLQRQIYKENTNIPDKEEGFDHMNDALGYLIDYIKPLTIKTPGSIPQRWDLKGNYGVHKDEALDTHKDYRETINNWEYFIRSYNGGYDYTIGQYLNRYNLELDNEFNQRLANTPCDNHCKNIIQIYSSFLFRVKPSRDFGSMSEEPSLESFLKDADLEGNSFNNVIKQAQNYASIYGHCFMILDKPTIQTRTRVTNLIKI